MEERPMKISSRVSELQQAMGRYGDASVRNAHTLHALGEQIIAALSDYLGEGATIMGMPPSGEWRTDGGEYRDAKFSTYGNGLLQVADFDGFDNSNTPYTVTAT